MEKMFQLLKKRRNISAISGVRISLLTKISNLQQPQYMATKHIIHCATIQNTPSVLTVSTQKQFSEGNIQQPIANSQQLTRKRQKTTGNYCNKVKWHLISLVMFLIIIIWLNGLGLSCSTISFKASAINNNGCQISEVTCISNLTI